ncbi:MAG TPA: CBS domain-containing protein [Terriglobia bacterium]|nr:CBS domain-containing protein [Terriglobia bacterium]
MKVHEVMTRGIETVPSGATLEAAGKKMLNRNVGFLPVVESEKLVGVVTDRDIVTRAVSAGLRPAMTRVSEVMTKNVLTVYDDASLTETSLLMEKNLVHRLVVLDHEGRLVGIVSLSDIAAKTNNERLSGHVLGKVVAA